VQILNHLTITEDNILVSFDVESLFTKSSDTQHTGYYPGAAKGSIPPTAPLPSYTREKSANKSKGPPWDPHYPHY
jgi:hypothetical protein